MAELIVSPYLLAVVFLIVAGVYGSVGLGGGSTYIALLTIFQADYEVIPAISLSLNVVVTTVGAFNFTRAGHFRTRLVVPLLATSMPAAYLGGRMELSGPVYEFLLLGVLTCIAARIYLWEEPSVDLEWEATTSAIVCLLVGATIGGISGMIGIGGGILLIPCILLLGLGTAKEAATAGVLLTGLNSISGLTAHLQRHIPDLDTLAPLLVAVFIGGVVGSHVGASRWEADTVRKVLGGVVLAAAVLLAIRIWG